MAGPKLPDIKTFIKAGIDPKTRLPVRLGSDNNHIEDGMRMIFRIIDEQDSTNRYVWSGLPTDITGQELERMLYYKGQLAFFYFKELDRFMFMPYALDGTIDFYGRYNEIKPVPMTSGTDAEDKKRQGMQLQLLSMKRLKVKYGVVDDEDLTEDDLFNSAVLLHDYTKQLSQTIIPRKDVNEPLLSVMSEIVPFLRTALIAGTGIKGMRVNDADQEESVTDANKSFVRYAKQGKLYMPLTGAMEVQEIADGSVVKAEEYMQSLQSLDNLRKSTHGIDNGGLFEKQAHILESENALNQSAVMNQLQDGLTIRQNFCNIVNSIWGLGMWCDLSENVINLDTDGDGQVNDQNYDGANSSVEEEKGDSEE